MTMHWDEYVRLANNFVKHGTLATQCELTMFLDKSYGKMKEKVFNYKHDKKDTWLYQDFCLRKIPLGDYYCVWKVNKELWRKVYGKDYME